MEHKLSHKAITGAIFCNLLWGSAYPFIKLGYQYFGITDGVFDQILFAGLRFIIAGVLVLIVSGAREKRAPLPTRSNIGAVLLTACVYTALQYVFFYTGLARTTGANGSIVNSSTTFIAVILSHFVFKDDRLTVKKVIGELLGFSGVLLVTGGMGGVSFRGEGFIFIAAICFVVGSWLNKRAARVDSAVTVTGWSLSIGGVILTLAGLIGGGRLNSPTFAGVATLIYLAFLSAAAFTIWNALLTANPIGKMSVFNFIIPVSGTILSGIFLGENIADVRYLISLVLICAGIYAVTAANTLPKRRKK